MSTVLLAFDEVGVGVQWADFLEAAGYSVTLGRTDNAMPDEDAAARPDAIVLPGAPGELDLAACVDAWRSVPEPAAVLIAGRGDAERAVAHEHAVTFIGFDVDRAALVAAVERALAMRYAARLSPLYAARLLGLDLRATDEDSRAVMIVGHSRSANLDVVSEALRPRTYHYVSPTPVIDRLRAVRALRVPEVNLVLSLDGAHTAETTMCSGRMDLATAARLLWALACVDGIRLTPEPIDSGTTARRAVTAARFHLRARRDRLRRGKATYYDVLEVPLGAPGDMIARAVARLAVRFSPEILAGLDLGDHAAYVDPLWQQIVQAQTMLSDATQTAQYLQYLRGRGIDVEAQAHQRGIDPGAAANDFRFGQQALVKGDVFQAVSRFAKASRQQPGHTDYEVYLAWARYRADVQRGADKLATAQRERAAAEAMLAGRQPRAQALMALGLLCVAAEDASAARWHLGEALRVDPELARARQMMERLKQQG
jgi:hypothetical protein